VWGRASVVVVTVPDVVSMAMCFLPWSPRSKRAARAGEQNRLRRLFVKHGRHRSSARYGPETQGYQRLSDLTALRRWSTCLLDKTGRKDC
jgi:hypothetical protein